jgi:hypothetical protein
VQLVGGARQIQVAGRTVERAQGIQWQVHGVEV